MKQKKVITSIHIADLISRYLFEELEESEKSELFNWVNLNPQNQHFFQQLLNEDHLDRQGQALKMFDTSAALEQVKIRKLQSLTPIRKRKFRSWKLTTVAAAVLICMGAAIYFYQSEDYTSLPNAEIGPGKNAATLILSNGKKLLLTDRAEGQLAEEPGVKISKNTQGQLVYELTGKESTASAASNHANLAITYNTLVTARGEQYQVNLPDGTRVWLNAASSLRFPSNFEHSAIRDVELSGEAFFEVAKNKAQPFIVKTAKQQVRVFGTHFNLSAYPDEQQIRTTLLEGSVKVTLMTSRRAKMLIPGQQSEILNNEIRINTPTDLEEITAWKNGYFKFNESLQSIMTKISRWYDVEVIYEVNPTADLAFSAKISRNRSLSELLKLIELTGGVHFKIEGRRVIVTK